MKIILIILLSLFSLYANNFFDQYDAKSFKVELEFRSYDSTLLSTDLNLLISYAVINPQQIEYIEKHGRVSSLINTFSGVQQNVTTKNGKVQLSFKNAIDPTVAIVYGNNISANRHDLGGFPNKKGPGGKYTFFVHTLNGGESSMSSIYIFGKKVPFIYNQDSTGVGICFPESVTSAQIDQAIEFNVNEPKALTENKNLTLYMLPNKEGFELISQHELLLCDVKTDNWTIFDTLPKIGSTKWKNKLIISPKKIKGEAFFFGWYLKSANRFGKGVLHVLPKFFKKKDDIKIQNYIVSNDNVGERTFYEFSRNQPSWLNNRKYLSSELEKLDTFTPIPEWNYPVEDK